MEAEANDGMRSDNISLGKQLRAHTQHFCDAAYSVPHLSDKCNGTLDLQPNE